MLRCLRPVVNCIYGKIYTKKKEKSPVLQHGQERKFVVSRLEENTTTVHSYIYSVCLIF